MSLERAIDVMAAHWSQPKQWGPPPVTARQGQGRPTTMRPERPTVGHLPTIRRMTGQSSSDDRALLRTLLVCMGLLAFVLAGTEAPGDAGRIRVGPDDALQAPGPQ
jgi:hypothetical protein